ncbi:MAG: Rrf2 family transcriptional regulator [Allobaculum sp.]|nr:Rrf2 family transcriptional regulator [Allobaculum sp.]
MSIDTRFSSALHFLILVSESQKPMSSAQIATSLGTNPSYVRKLAGYLKKADLIESHQGIPGFSLKKPASEITFWEIMKATMDTDTFHLFEIHKNPNDACIVGAHIRPVLSNIFAQLDQSAQDLLDHQSLQNCIDQMRKHVEQEPLIEGKETRYESSNS